jgi:S-adenosylmethionine hydrolase
MAKGKRGVITLSTDFGTQDGNVGVMKGVIYRINPCAAIVDLSHDIAPQDIPAAAYVLRRAYTYFPHGTVHVVVVDPGVGTERRAMAVQSKNAFFVAPDNGVLTYVLQKLADAAQRIRTVNLTNPAYWLPSVSNVFHGRDIFAPVAAHLSLGVEIAALGEEIQDVIMLPPLHLEKTRGRITGQVAHIDRFGNLLTNVHQSDLTALGDSVTISLAQRRIEGLTKTFAQAQTGELIAYVDSSSHLAIAVVTGSAQRLLDAQVGELVTVATPQHTALR